MIPSIITVVLLALGAIGQDRFNRYPSEGDGMLPIWWWCLFIFVIGGTWLIWALAK